MSIQSQPCTSIHWLSPTKTFIRSVLAIVLNYLCIGHIAVGSHAGYQTAYCTSDETNNCRCPLPTRFVCGT